MNLVELFWMGGWQFMAIITIFGVCMIYHSVKHVITLYVKKESGVQGLNYILLFGSLAIIFGLLAQAIGMFEAMDSIQKAGDISPAIVAGGIRVSMIAPLYGALIFIVSLPVWFVLREKIKRNNS